MVDTIDEIELSIADIRKLIEVIKKSYNYDFSNYALTAFKRRISKFLLNNNSCRIDDMITRISFDKTLFNNFLMEVRVEGTELFRDPSFWRYFRDKTLQVLNNNYMRINIWVVNSSSADEVYTLAIVLKESGLFDKTNIFATDYCNDLLKNPLTGEFPIYKLENSEANYKRYNDKGSFHDYIKVDKHVFRLNENLLSNTKFLFNDLSDASPARGIHMILSRNNFIYYNSNMQDNILHVFYKNLALNGYLVLGIKESIGGSRDAKKFVIENDHEKVYKKIEA